MKIISPVFFALVFALVSSSAQADNSNGSNVIPFQINVQTQHFSTVENAQLETFEMMLMVNKMNYTPINLPGVNDYYKSGYILTTAEGIVMGYVVTNGKYVGTYWKLAFDPMMNPGQRQRLLQLITPYVQTTLNNLERAWEHVKHEQGNKPLRIVVDFLEPDLLAKKWALDLFGKYPEAVLEDTSKGTEFTFERIRSIMPPDMKSPAISATSGNVVSGYEFGRVYSPNLRRYLSFTDKGTLDVIDARTGKVVGTIVLPQSGAPRVQYTSTQVVLDYGAGQKRYHFGTGSYTLLYATENWRAPQRGQTVQRSCRDIFVL